MKKKAWNRRKLGDWLFVALMVLPALAVYVRLYLIPGIQAFEVSMYDWKGFSNSTMKYVGLENYKNLLKDKIFLQALENNLVIIFIGGILVITLGLFFANFLCKKRTLGKGVLRSLIFAPYAISVVAIGIVWTFVFNPSFGMLNSLLEGVGIDAVGFAWLGKRSMAMGCIVFVTIWWWVGFLMTLLTAGIQRIPEDYYEAARIDGASDTQLFWHITFPLIRSVLNVGILYWIINGWMAFGVTYVMTQGGPSNQTHTAATYMVWESVDYIAGLYKMGYGSAIAVSLLVIVVITTIIYRTIMRMGKEYVEL